MVISNGTVDFATIGLVGELSVDVTKLMEQVGKIQQFINDFDVLLDSGKRISDAVQRTFAAGNLQQIQTESGQALEAFVTFLQQEVQKLDQLQAFIANKIFESVLPLVPTLLDGGVKLGVYTAALGTYSTLCSLATDKAQCNADHGPSVTTNQQILDSYMRTQLQPQMEAFVANITSQQTIDELTNAALLDLGEFIDALGRALKLQKLEIQLTKIKEQNGSVTYSFSIAGQGAAPPPAPQALLIPFAHAQTAGNCVLSVQNPDGTDQAPIQSCTGELTLSTGISTLAAAAIQGGETAPLAAGASEVDAATGEQTETDTSEPNEPDGCAENFTKALVIITGTPWAGDTIKYELSAAGALADVPTSCEWKFEGLTDDGTVVAVPGEIFKGPEAIDVDIVNSGSSLAKRQAQGCDEFYIDVPFTKAFLKETKVTSLRVQYLVGFELESGEAIQCSSGDIRQIIEQPPADPIEEPDEEAETDEGTDDNGGAAPGTNPQIGVPDEGSKYQCKASNAVGLPIVPCGRAFDSDGNELNCPCQFCHFFQLGSNIMRFITVLLVPVMAALFVVIGGFIILMSGPSPDRRKKGLDLITKTIQGALIVYVAWIIINTAFLFFVNPEIITGGRFPQFWHQVECPIEGLEE